MVSSLAKAPWHLRCIAGVMIIAIAGYGAWYTHHHRKLLHHTEEQMRTLTEQRSTAIQKFMTEQQTNLENIFQHNDIMEKIQKVASSIDTEEGARKLYEQQLDALIKAHHTLLSYENMIIASHDGNIIYSDIPAYQRKTVYDPGLAESALGKSLMRVIMTLSPDISDFSYDTALKAPALFVTTPIFRERKLTFIVAMNIDINNLYDITDNYINLGSTGEVIISKVIQKGSLFLNKSRTQSLLPFKKFIPMTTITKGEHLAPTQEAPLGNQGSGIIFDYRKVLSVASWQFIPKVDWGITAKIDVQEVTKQLTLYTQIGWVLVALLLCSLFILLKYDARAQQYVMALRDEGFLHKTLLLGLVGSIMITGVSIFMLHVAKSHEKYIMQTLVTEKMKHARQDMQQILRSIELATQTLAHDLARKQLSPEEVVKFFEQTIRSTPYIAGISVAYAPYKYSPDRKLFARYVTKTANGYNVHNLDELYDYTVAAEKSSGFRVFYLDALQKHGLLWLKPRKEELSGLFVAPCSEDFFVPNAHGTQETMGAVTIFLDMAPIQKIAASINISPTSYSYIISKAGDFIYHPQQSFLDKEITMKDFAEGIASPDLITISKKAQQGAEGFFSFTNMKTKTLNDIYFTPLPIPEWSLGVIFPRSDSLPSLQTLRHHYIMIVFGCTLIALFLLSIMLKLYRHDRQTAFFLMGGITAPLFICQIGLLFIAYTTSEPSGRKKIISTDMVGLQRFVTEQEAIAEIVHEKKPLPLPTGLELDSVSFPLEEGIKIAGFIWQKYDHVLHKDLAREVLFSQASSRVQLVKKYEALRGNATVVGWKFYLQMPLEFDFTKYPLDMNRITINLEHPDLRQNVLLVPDFSDYQDISPTSLPGLAKGINISGFNINSSQFTFEFMPQKTTYGIEPFGQAISYLIMNFDVEITRNITYAILVFFLPIFVILFAIYAIFVLNEMGSLDSYKALATYTGMLLTIIFLHRSLRERYLTGSILYIEYYFFITYVTLLILMMHILLKQTPISHKAWYRWIFYIYRTSFWNIMLIVSLGITLMIFY